MKNDAGESWTKKDYPYAIIAALLLVIIICIPAGILLLFDYITGWKYHWIAWGIIFAIVFLIGLFSKQIVSKIFEGGTDGTTTTRDIRDSVQDK